MTKDVYILCRRDIGTIGVRDYCARPLSKVNPLNWCDDCLKRLPIWASDYIADDVDLDLEDWMREYGGEG
jgi:hypothetical protein